MDDVAASWNPVHVRREPDALSYALTRASAPAAVVTGERLRGHVDGATQIVARSAQWADIRALATQLVQLPGHRSVIALGGGSVLDATKLACAVADTPQAQSANLADLASGRVALNRTRRLWAIPTTAGTGSEVTSWSSVWTADGSKISVEAPCLYPDYAVVDPALTQTMDPRLTAATGLDATAHAVESIWSVNCRPEAEAHAAHALQLVGAHLPAAVSAPDDCHRAAMSDAALHAGLALSHCRSTAAHALSYPLTGILGLEHGLAVALMLRAVLPATAKLAPDRVLAASVALNVDGASGIDSFISSVLSRAGLGDRLRDFGVSRTLLDHLADSAVEQQRFGNHPPGLTPDALGRALLSIY